MKVKLGKLSNFFFKELIAEKTRETKSNGWRPLNDKLSPAYALVDIIQDRCNVNIACMKAPQYLRPMLGTFFTSQVLF